MTDRLVRFFRYPEIPMINQQISDETRHRAVTKDLKRVINQGGGATEFGYILREGIPANTPWLFDPVTEDILKIGVTLAEYGRWGRW